MLAGRTQRGIEKKSSRSRGFAFASALDVDWIRSSVAFLFNSRERLAVIEKALLYRDGTTPETIIAIRRGNQTYRERIAITPSACL